ncbi:hypothetical protein C942_04646 [Photobacterium marinum]|uniref:Uncharacterized protein n=1 Tax=Photobacterium marinum TaxID=1056511 RepID=L8JHL9_9GAMM|nr:hypothetical protein C942_04646 [Photobacterium marinum]
MDIDKVIFNLLFCCFDGFEIKKSPRAFQIQKHPALSRIFYVLLLDG